MTILHKEKLISRAICALLVVGALCFTTACSSSGGDTATEDTVTQETTTEDTAQDTAAPDATDLDLAVTITAESPLALVLGGTETANLNATATAEGLPEGAQIVFAYVVSNDSISVDDAGNVTALALSTVKPFVTITAQYDADGDGVADSEASLATKKVQVLVTDNAA